MFISDSVLNTDVILIKLQCFPCYMPSDVGHLAVFLNRFSRPTHP